jgi:hypothetical protein
MPINPNTFGAPPAPPAPPHASWPPSPHAPLPHLSDAPQSRKRWPGILAGAAAGALVATLISALVTTQIATTAANTLAGEGNSYASFDAVGGATFNRITNAAAAEMAALCRRLAPL